MNDSIAEATAKAAQAEQDSIAQAAETARQDSIAKAEEASQKKASSKAKPAKSTATVQQAKPAPATKAETNELKGVNSKTKGALDKLKKK
ncbi:MAG: hypothetical protein IPP51_08790 [Bacteroidetes bacterium]|nr:hypothetical protein [Bacteroidota bacterium]